MPVYCYTTEDGTTVEQFHHVGKAPDTVKLDDGRVARRDMHAEWCGRNSLGDLCPETSTAMGCPPYYQEKMKAFLRTKGVEAKYDKEGRAILRDKAHRKAMMRALGLVDRSRYG
jgi:hypothetical protein